MSEPTLVSVPAPPAPTGGPRVFTEDEVNAIKEQIRQEEKGKLYPTIEEVRNQNRQLDERVRTFESERETYQRQQREAEEAAAAAEEARRISELTALERMQEATQQTTQQVNELREAVEARDRMLALERQYADLERYKQSRLTSDQDEAQRIIPELRDLVMGSTQQEIDSSITTLVARSDAIMQQVTGQAQAFRQQMPTVGITAPVTGPSDVAAEQINFSLDDLKNMSVAQYAQHRQSLLGAAGGGRSLGRQSNGGMFD